MCEEKKIYEPSRLYALGDITKQIYRHSVCCAVTLTLPHYGWVHHNITISVFYNMHIFAVILLFTFVSFHMYILPLEHSPNINTIQPISHLSKLIIVFKIVLMFIRSGADKSLARPRTESIASLERGPSSYAESQVFSGYKVWKEACQATHAISTTSRRELSSFFFPSKARRRRKF
jgi:hypothetical protein